MMSSWWWLWWIAMFAFLAPPMGYGWGYRRWGVPYPRFVQRRRHARATAGGRLSELDHQSWGWGGDFVWGVLLFGTVTALAVAFWF